MKYNKVTIYKDADGNFKEAKVDTNLGELTVTDSVRLAEVLSEFASQKSMTVTDLMLDAGLVSTVTESVLEESDVEIDEEAEIEVEEEVDEEEVSREEELDEIIRSVDRRKKKGRVKRLIAGGTLFIVLLTGGVHLNKHTNAFNGLKAMFNKKPSIELQVESTGLTSVGTGIAGDEIYAEEMKDVIGRHEESSEVIAQVAEAETKEMSFDEWMQAIDDVSMIAHAGMFEISEYVNGSELIGTSYYNNFENSFTNPSDYAAVKFFSDIRNEVIRLSYEAKDKDAVISEVRHFYTMYTEFVSLEKGYAFEINGQTVNAGFYDLSPMARATILNLGFAMMSVDVDYTYYNENDNTKVDKFAVIEKSSELYNEELSRIEDYGFKR